MGGSDGGGCVQNKIVCVYVCVCTEQDGTVLSVSDPNEDCVEGHSSSSTCGLPTLRHTSRRVSRPLSPRTADDVRYPYGTTTPYLSRTTGTRPVVRRTRRDSPTDRGVVRTIVYTIT